MTRAMLLTALLVTACEDGGGGTDAGGDSRMTEPSPDTAPGAVKDTTPDAHTIRDSRMPETTGEVPPDDARQGNSCVEGKQCVHPEKLTVGICRGGACCLGCWDGQTCQAGTTSDHCGKQGRPCQSCGFIPVNAFGFCRSGEETRFRQLCAENGGCSMLTTSTEVRCCSLDTCRVP